MKNFRRLALLGTLLALCVVVLGAWVRLSDAGLGCPDWPGCYGQLTVPSEESAIREANAAFPERPLEPVKALREMVHRYFAGVLGLLVLALAVLAWRNRREPGQPLRLPVFLLGLIIAQALLGMYTVTLLLKPVIVLAHLLGGLATLGLLAWLAMPSPARVTDSTNVRMLAVTGLFIVVIQIALGGWTSANYAALACPDFPTCQTQWWPPADFGEGFVLWRGLGVDYEGGVLDNAARVAIHLTHRIGALVTSVFLVALSVMLLLRRGEPLLRLSGGFIAAILAIQILVGVLMVVGGLPLTLATTHNGVAALLLLAIIGLNRAAWPGERGGASISS